MDLLADGWNVEMGNFGFFSTSLQCPPVKDKKEIRAASVQMKNINFRASRPFKKEVGDKMRLQRGESITRPKKNSISRETCRDRLNKYLENHLFISRTDYSHLTGRNKKVAIEELNSYIADRRCPNFFFIFNRRTLQRCREESEVSHFYIPSVG